MVLREVVDRLSEFGDELLLICVQRPWEPMSEAQVVVPAEDLGVPVQVRAAGFEYFVDTPVANEVLGVFGDRPVTTDDKVRLLIHYAEHDAFPAWVYREQ